MISRWRCPQRTISSVSCVLAGDFSWRQSGRLSYSRHRGPLCHHHCAAFVCHFERVRAPSEWVSMSHTYGHIHFCTFVFFPPHYIACRAPVVPKELIGRRTRPCSERERQRRWWIGGQLVKDNSFINSRLYQAKIWQFSFANSQLEGDSEKDTKRQFYPTFLFSRSAKSKKREGYFYSSNYGMNSNGMLKHYDDTWRW